MLFPVELPPGVFRSGTELQSSGRYYDADLIRWQNGALQPIGGWRLKTSDTVTGAARAIRAWPDNSGQAWVGVGTHSGLYVMDRGGVVYDITPTGYVTGLEDSDFRGGYGNGNYGEGTYGTPREDSTNPNDVTVWSLEPFQGNLLACTADDGLIYQWELNTSLDAAPVSGAPTCRAIHVTAEGAVMALGANGNPGLVKHSDTDDVSVWTATTTNEAREYPLQTSGKLMCGRKVKGGSLLFTTADVWLATFIGFPYVYGYRQVGGAGTGIVAQGAVANLDGDAVPASAVWMGQQGFFAYNGAVTPLTCDVGPYVFNDINRSQISKVSAWHNADWGEVTFFYPSASSTEIDRYVTWNYRENWWTIGYSLDRLCGCEKGPLANPLAVDADGNIYEHEVGLDYDDATPFAETGDFLIGEGDRVVAVDELVPDEQTLGDVQATFYTKLQPMGTETERGPYSLSTQTFVRWTARIFRVRFTGVRLSAWKVGRMKLNGIPAGKR